MTALPPGPRLPVAAQSLAWAARPVPFVLRAQQRFGDMYTIRIATEPPWVMLGHPDLVKEVFTGSPDVFHAGEANAILRPFLGDNSVLLLDGREHMRERKLLLPPFHGERMQRYGELMRGIAEEEVDRWPAGEAFPLAPRMQAVTLEIIMRAVFGVRADARLAALRSALVRLLELIVHPAAMMTAGVLGLERAAGLRPIRRALEAVDELVYEEIAAHRGDEGLAGRDDILSLLLQATDEDGRPMSDQQLRDELMTLLVAGHETTANALAWSIERLIRTPAAWDRLVTESHAGESTYAQAVAHETLRLRPVIPVVVRRLKSDAEIGGRLLPAGTTVAPSIVMVHRRADVYPEPHAFRPSRFLDAKPGTYTWIPFGGGVRRCLGAAFALYEMQVVLGVIARSARLRAVDPAPEGLTRRAIAMSPAGAATVIRDPSPVRTAVPA